MGHDHEICFFKQRLGEGLGRQVSAQAALQNVDENSLFLQFPQRAHHRIVFHRGGDNAHLGLEEPLYDDVQRVRDVGGQGHIFGIGLGVASK